MNKTIQIADLMVSLGLEGINNNSNTDMTISDRGAGKKMRPGNAIDEG